VRRAFALVASLLLGLSCSLDQKLPDKQRFILVVEAPQPPTDPGGGGVLRVHRFRASPVFERKSLVYRTAKDKFVEDFYNELYAPPGVLVREITARYLRDAGIFEVVLEPNDPRRADWLLEGRIENLYADKQDTSRTEVILDVEFTLVDENSPELDVVFARMYAEQGVAASASAEDIVRGLTANLRRILERLAQDLHDQVENTGSDPGIDAEAAS